MPRVIRLTFRPTATQFSQITLDQFWELILPKRGYEAYLVSEERGKEDIPSHFECWLKTSERTDAVGKRIRSKLQSYYGNLPENASALLDPAVHLSTVKEQDETYTLGYCLKESLKDDTLRIHTSLTKQVLQDALDTYTKQNKFTKQKSKGSLTLDQLTFMVLEKHRETSSLSYDPHILTDLLACHDVSYTVYSRIKHEVLKDWVLQRLGVE